MAGEDGRPGLAPCSCSKWPWVVSHTCMHVVYLLDKFIWVIGKSEKSERKFPVAILKGPTIISAENNCLPVCRI